MKSTICVAEDRETCEPSLKLLLVSLAEHCPNSTVSLFYPPAKDRFLTWLKKYPQVRMQVSSLTCGLGWNVKPQAILRLLDEGFEEVVWIDSDILVNQDIRGILAGLSIETIAVSDHTLGAPERGDHNGFRARSWGLPIGRVLSSALSSGVVRATKHHYQLMKRWWELLQSDAYQGFQKKDWYDRPFHMLGDQDVLTALLTSTEFAHIPIFVFRRGKHIIQFDGVWGYTVPERLRNLVGDGPALIHSGAGKPWSEDWTIPPPTAREYIKRSYLDLSPYTLWARRFKVELDCSTEWMKPHYLLSRFLRVLGMGNPALSGLPLAVLLDFARLAKRVRKPREKPGVPRSAEAAVSKGVAL